MWLRLKDDGNLYNLSQAERISIEGGELAMWVKGKKVVISPSSSNLDSTPIARKKLLDMIHELLRGAIVIGRWDGKSPESVHYDADPADRELGFPHFVYNIAVD
jgi:hypothetical protein